MPKLNVIIKGFLRSGSSALQDMLMEYDGVGRVPGEFDFFRQPQMVGDHLHGLINDDYPSRVEECISREENLLHSFGFRIKYILRNSVLRIIPDQIFQEFGYLPNSDFNNLINGRRINVDHLKSLKPLLKSNAPLSQKVEATNRWINQISNEFVPNRKFVLFDHAIWEWHELEIWRAVFEPFKIIFVYRDPRDQIADVILDKHLFRFWNLKLSYAYGRDRSSAIKFNADIIYKTLLKAEKICEGLGKEQALMISFEQLVMDYENSKIKIENFLGLNSSDHVDKHDLLNPDEAKQNIGIFQHVLNETDLLQIKKITDWYLNKKLEQQNNEYQSI